MADAKEGAPKKKNMLPVILAVVAVLGGGGYFMMSGKKEAKVEPEIALAHASEDAGEFLVNLRGGGYLSTKIALQCALEQTVSSGGGGHGAAGAIQPFVNDAIISVLTSKSMDDVTSVEGKLKLKRELAYYINHAAHTFAHEEGAEDKKSSKKKKKSSSHEPQEGGVPEELTADFEPEYPEWDSDEGPVLKVFFLTFTTQG
jgi:flagellar FliL protein